MASLAFTNITHFIQAAAIGGQGADAISTETHGTVAHDWLDESDDEEVAQDDETSDGESATQGASSEHASLVTEPSAKDVTCATLQVLDQNQRDLGRGLSSSDGKKAMDAAAEDTRSPTEQLKLIEEEFGVWKDGGEKWLQQLPGTLMRSVVIKGVIALTNKRLLYLAYVPSTEPGKIIKSGSLTVHEKGLVGRKLRRWCELRPDGVTGYKSSDKTYKPTWAGSLSEIKTVSPWKAEKPHCVFVQYDDGQTFELECDTVEAAQSWQIELVAALFRFRANSDKIRISIPLVRIERILLGNVSGFAKLMDIRPKMDAKLCQTHTAAATVLRLVEGEEPTPQILLGYLISHDGFSDRVMEEMKKAQEAESAQPSVDIPPVVLELGYAKPIDAENHDPAQKTVDVPELQRNFIKVFGLPPHTSDLFVMRCSLVRHVPALGAIAVGGHYFCFWQRNYVSKDFKLKVPLSDVESAQVSRAFGLHVYAMSITVHGFPEIRMDFISRDDRDKTIEVIMAARDKELKYAQSHHSGSILDPLIEKKMKPLGQIVKEKVIIPVGMRISAKVLGHGLEPSDRVVEKMNIVCMTIGSRGDVQPYIALGTRLQKDGHSVTIASHPEYRDWCEGNGLKYKEVGGDPAALMKVSIEHPILSPGFFKDSVPQFRQWLDDLFQECWEACQGADLLIQSPSTFAGIHIAEALNIPFLQAFTMPWTKTATYPQAFAAGVDLGPSYNLLTYSLFDNLIWKAMAGQVNRWRKGTLHLPSTTWETLRPWETPFIYNFSQAVCPRPNDWKDTIAVSGYWFLDSPPIQYTPSKELEAFMDSARKSGKALIYVGFGSITVPDANAVTLAIYEAVQRADVRAIVVKGWSERGSAKPIHPITVPSEVFVMDSVPHDWLFPLIDAACHHGGAGTTGASLKFGLPTLIHPFFGDQMFWAQRVTKLGAGMKVDTLTTNDLAEAFKVATTDRVMKEKAAQVGTKIRNENGVSNAIQFIYTHIPLARQRCEERALRAKSRKSQKHQHGALSKTFTESSLTPGLSRTTTEQSGRSITFETLSGSGTLVTSPAASPAISRAQITTDASRLPDRELGSLDSNPSTPKRQSTLGSIASKIAKTLH